MAWASLGTAAAGLALLALGGELLVRGAARVALAARISPLVIGLTLVAFGTSAPELAVSVEAVFSGRPGLAIGNVVGSNTFNVLFTLGACAVIVPLAVSRQLLRREVPLMVGVSLLVWLLALDGSVSRWEGALLVAGVAAYTVFAIRESRRESAAQAARQPAGPGAGGRPVVPNLFLAAAGLAGLVVGARWLVEGATEIARTLGVSELVIGLTLVAAGTSLPEVATSVVATARGEREIAIGNVVGSNIFNLLAILGVAAGGSPVAIRVPAAALAFDIPVMVAAAVACLPVFFTGGKIARWEGALFLGYYAAYISFLFLHSIQHQALPLASAVMLWFVAPLTALGLGALALRAWIRPGGGGPA
jgi:cation:H+ antiporter